MRIQRPIAIHAPVAAQIDLLVRRKAGVLIGILIHRALVGIVARQAHAAGRIPTAFHFKTPAALLAGILRGGASGRVGIWHKAQYIFHLILKQVQPQLRYAGGLPDKGGFPGVGGFRLQIGVTERGWVVDGIHLDKRRGAESTAIQQLGGEVVVDRPHQRGTRIGGAAKIGVIVVAQAQRQRPILGQLPFVLREYEQIITTMGSHEWCGICEVDQAAERHRHVADTRHVSKIEVLAFGDMANLGFFGAGTNTHTVILEAGVETGGIQPLRAIFARWGTNHAVRIGAAKGARRKHHKRGRATMFVIAGLGAHLPVFGKVGVAVIQIRQQAVGVETSLPVQRVGHSLRQLRVVALRIVGTQAPFVVGQINHAVNHIAGALHRARRIRGRGTEQLVQATLRIRLDGFVRAVSFTHMQAGGQLEWPEFAAMLNPAFATVVGASPHAGQRAIDVAAGFGNDVDHAGKGIGTIQSRAGAANDFDTGNIFRRNGGPAVAPITQIRAGQRHAVEQHQHLRVVFVVYATNRIHRVVQITHRDMQARHRLQCLVNIARAGGGNVFGGDHRGHRRGARQRLFGTGGNRDERFIAIDCS